MNFFSEEPTKVLLFILNYMAGTPKFTSERVKTSPSPLYKVSCKGRTIGGLYLYPSITIEDLLYLYPSKTIEDLGDDLLFMLGVPYTSHNYANLFIES